MAKKKEEAPVQAEPEQNGGKKMPLKTWTFPVGKDTWIQASVWDRIVELANGDSFVTHDIRVQKRFRDARERDPEKQWKTLHSYRVSELFTLQHAINKAGDFVLALRGQPSSKAPDPQENGSHEDIPF